MVQLCLSLFFLTILSSMIASSNGECARAKTPMARLKEDIFCNYDKFSRPVRHPSSPVEVAFSIVLQRVEMEERRQTIEIEAVIRMWWMDENISWKSSEYGNITYMKVEEVWMPDLTMNVRSQAVTESFQPKNCILLSNGMVSCLPTVKVSAPCTQDVHRWPFDKHVCYFNISSFLYFEHEFTMRSNNVTTSFLIPSREWDFGSIEVQRKYINFTKSIERKSYPVMTYTINITRHAGFYAATNVLPSLMLLTIVLTSFWLGNRFSCRLIMLEFVLMSCTMFLNYLVVLIPPNGDTVPVIVTVFRDCMALATFALVVATVVNRLSTSERVPPLWLANVTDRVELSILGPILFLTPHNDKTNLWSSQAILLDRIAFITSFIVVCVLLTDYLP